MNAYETRRPTVLKTDTTESEPQFWSAAVATTLVLATAELTLAWA